MCGYVGMFLNNNFNIEHLKLMSETIKNRGPDDSGEYINLNKKISIAHRRLSILDTSNAGHQPMHSHSGRYVIAYNGEIYNHIYLRKIIENHSNFSHSWRGNSDTETILSGFEIFGIEETIKQCTGMFSMAVWDNKLDNLSLIRDRIGEKPLYYGFNNNIFFFGSDVKSFLKNPHFKAEIDNESLELFFALNFIPTPKSIYQNIYKLPAGHILDISLKNKNYEIREYWSLRKNDFNLSYDETIEKTEFQIEETVKNQMISDVPIGSFLSGGIDSSLVTYYMQKNSTKKIKTFTIGFDDAAYDESMHAKKVSNFLGTDHHEILINDSSFVETIPKLNKIYSEPFADSSQVISYLISKKAKEDVTVILSGDGGDESFAGYNRYLIAEKLFNLLNNNPYIFKIVLPLIFKLIPINAIDNLNSITKKFINSKYLVNNLSERIDKLRNTFNSKTNNEIYKSMITRKNQNLFNFKNTNFNLLEKFLKLDIKNVDDIIYKDIQFYLPDDIMCKVDRSSMESSLETRMPLADFKLIENSYSIDNKFKLRNNDSKHILKKIMYNHIPKKIMDRPKMGFEVPLAKLLRSSLLDWAESLLNKNQLINYGFFNHKEIIKLWNLHKSGKGNYHYHLWSILIFMSWSKNL